MSSKASKISLSHVMFLLSGLAFIVYYLISKGIPSLGDSVESIMSFIVELFVIIVLIGFYFFFLFQGKNCAGALRAFAPALLIFIVCGSYSLSFGSAEANAIITGIAQMAYLLIIVCGFVFLFVHLKTLGMVFSFSAVIYAAFVTLSYSIVTIISLTNGGEFSVSKLLETLIYVLGLGFLFVGGFQISKHRDW